MHLPCKNKNSHPAEFHELSDLIKTTTRRSLENKYYAMISLFVHTYNEFLANWLGLGMIFF